MKVLSASCGAGLLVERLHHLPFISSSSALAPRFSTLPSPPARWGMRRLLTEYARWVFATMPTQNIARMSDGPPLAARNIARLLACLLLDWPTSPSISTLHQRLALTACVSLLHSLSLVANRLTSCMGKIPQEEIRRGTLPHSPPVLFSRPKSEIDTRTSEGAPSLHRERYELLANSARAWTRAIVRSIEILPMNSAWPANFAVCLRVAPWFLAFDHPSPHRAQCAH